MTDRNITKYKKSFAEYLNKYITYVIVFVLLWIFVLSRFVVVRDETRYLEAKFVETYFHKHRKGSSLGVTVLVEGEMQNISSESIHLNNAVLGHEGEVLRFYLYDDYTFFWLSLHTWKVETMDGEVIYEG